MISPASRIRPTGYINVNMKHYFFLHDPEFDITYRGSISRYLEIARGETGYEEFAGKVMNILTADYVEGHGYRWAPGSIWRFDEDGYVDQDYQMATTRATMDRVFSSNPYHPAKSAEWKMAMRRADAGNDFLERNPEVRRRLEDYILNDVPNTRIKSTRTLKRLEREI